MIYLKTNVMWSAKFYNFILEAENQTPSLKVSNKPLDAKKRKDKKRKGDEISVRRAVQAVYVSFYFVFV